MKKYLIPAALAAMFALPAQADNHLNYGVDKCIKAALDKHAGKVVSLRGELEEGKAQYEVDIKGKDGKIYEAECDAATGKVLETEEEVHAGDQAFTGKAKVGLDAALKTVLAKYPGAVIKIEYEIEPESIAYEFDIQGKDGKVTEIEVNAVTGKLGSPEEVLYQVGK